MPIDQNQPAPLRCRPYDLLQMKAYYSNDDSIADILTEIYANLPHNCPKCNPTGQSASPGLYLAADGITKIQCEVCDGYGKTATTWEAVAGPVTYVNTGQ